MKNLIIFYPSFEKGGVPKILVNFINDISRKKINIYLISSNFNRKLLNNKNVKIFNFSNKNFAFINNRIISSFISSFILIKLIGKLKRKETKILSVQSNFFSVIISYFFNIKIAVRVSEEPCSATKYADNIFFGIIIYISKFITYNLSTSVIANATKSQKCIQSIVLNKSKVKVLFNPYLNKIKKIRRTKKNYSFLNIGRFYKQKNQLCLIEAFNSFNKIKKNYILKIIGDGPNEKKLIDLAKKYKLQKKIKIIKWKKNLDTMYRNTDFFVLPSLYEGMPNVLIDAINYEVPSICSDASGVDDILLKGKGGIIIKNINHRNLGKALVNAVNNYSQILRRTKIAKKKLDIFLIRNASNKYLEFFNSL